jgi:hypothetical protein
MQETDALASISGVGFSLIGECWNLSLLLVLDVIHPSSTRTKRSSAAVRGLFASAHIPLIGTLAARSPQLQSSGSIHLHYVQGWTGNESAAIIGNVTRRSSVWLVFCES